MAPWWNPWGGCGCEDELALVRADVAHLATLVLAVQKQITEIRSAMMTQFDDVQTLVAAINDATNKVAAKIQALLDKINQTTGGLTVDQTAQLSTELGALKDTLTALGADPANPVPPTA